jgi:hypothetical protein
MAILLGGALTGVLALCAIAGIFILRTAGSPPQERLEPERAQQSAAQPRMTFTPFEVVPSACDVVDEAVALRLVPGSSARAHEGTETDDYSKCSWGDLGASDPRELSVEVRGVTGAQPIEAAKTAFQEQSQTDESGEALLPGQKLRGFAELKGIGEEAYELFVAERFQGQGLVNVRVGNVLILVTYGGSTKEETPLSQSKCLEGARQIAKLAAEEVRKAAA